jgi:hypothetical protein
MKIAIKIVASMLIVAYVFSVDFEDAFSTGKTNKLTYVNKILTFCQENGLWSECYKTNFLEIVQIDNENFVCFMWWYRGITDKTNPEPKSQVKSNEQTLPENQDDPEKLVKTKKLVQFRIINNSSANDIKSFLKTSSEGKTMYEENTKQLQCFLDYKTGSNDKLNLSLILNKTDKRLFFQQYKKKITGIKLFDVPTSNIIKFEYARKILKERYAVGKIGLPANRLKELIPFLNEAKKIQYFGLKVEVISALLRLKK